MTELVVIVGLFVIVGVQLFYIRKKDVEHRAEVQSLLHSALSAAGTPYVAPIERKPPDPPQGYEWQYSDDGFEAFKVPTS